MLARYGVNVAPIDDTMLLSYVLDGGLHRHNMGRLGRSASGRQNDQIQRRRRAVAKNQLSFAQVPLDQACPYAAEDADITLRLHRVFKPRLVKDHMVTVYERLERPLVHILDEMERTGIKVDAKKLKEFSVDFEKRMAEFEAKAHELAGHEFNIGSPKQLGEVLFDEMSLQGGKKG